MFWVLKNETVLLSTHNICIGREIRKLIFGTHLTKGLTIVVLADICRVCRCEGSSDKPLYHPCVCTGSIKFIHQDW